MEQLCRRIAMPEEMTEALLSAHQTLPWFPAMEALTQEAHWDAGLTRLEQDLGEDPRGLKMLCCMLRCAMDAKAEYDRLGIEEEIYYDTMACFSRFVGEHRVSFGHYGFDRAFWTVRQVSCKLFRVGLLEFELEKGAVSLHIPSDRPLDPEAVCVSLKAGRELIDRVFPKWKDAPYVCHSWLLSPTLGELLPERANILQFQKLFEIEPLSYDGAEFMEWVFKREDVPLEELPEDTSLQRKLKAHLLSGGRFRDARGRLRPEIG